ncbi:dynamin family protein [Alicyclobacillus sp. SO9]|uniref:dynamin family protein n=1 Tax=Alicyclobacillus sp. SO9 TaxID=2665646 RepID=UPI0018E6DC04|nr:dynamin family protein [Alicyclobacillus sp. SO9]QQE80258.1 dynamin family protein [Alicyclobacillus sp. SO9]
MKSMSIEELQTSVTTAVNRLQELPHSSHWDRPLLRLQQRLDNNQKLVAVFGAFSAGKSSLINALVGDNVLSVSPNPTTASISQVQYGSVPGIEITAKTEEQVQRDVDAAMTQLHKAPAPLTEAQQAATAMKLPKFSPAQRKYVSFLKSFARGFADMRDRLGHTWQDEWDQLQRYTADEHIAGFVDSVALSFAAPVLEEGLVLVDTPGVDSIHRRHTDVAFRYIQEADVVIFVLYYTHAFSRADKNFLQQLAGVQDVLGENKLIVAVNAVDLASSEAEKEDVLARVRDELTKLGLPHPVVIPVSSQLALAAKQWQAGALSEQMEAVVRKRIGLNDTDSLPDADEVFALSGFAGLETQVEQFAKEHVYSSLLDSVQRIFADTLGHISEHIDLLEKRQSATDEERSRLREMRNESVVQLSDLISALNNGQLSEEVVETSDWNELGFHAAQRIRLKFSQLFREAFYPGRFRQEAKAKIQLQDAAAELATSIAMQLDIESRTLWLRFQSSLMRAHAELRDKVGQLLYSCQIERSELLDTEYTMRDSEMPINEAQVSIDTFTPVLRHYRSAKQFFEGGGNQAALQQAEELVQPLLQEKIQSFQRQAEDKLRKGFRIESESLCQSAVAMIQQSMSKSESGDSKGGVDSDLRMWRELYQQFATELELLKSSRIS